MQHLESTLSGLTGYALIIAEAYEKKNRLTEV